MSSPLARCAPLPAALLALCITLGGCGVETASAVLVESTPGETAGSRTALSPEEEARHASLARWLTLPLPDTAEVRRAIDALEDGVGVWRAGRHREGARAVDNALARLPGVGDWRPLLRAELLVPTADTTSVRAALDELEPSGGLLARWGWEFLVLAHEAADDEPGALRAAERAAEAPWIGEARPVALARAGRLALALGDSTRARAHLRAALREGDEGETATRAAARILDRIAEPSSTSEQLALGRVLLAAGEWEGARRRLLPLVEDARLRESEVAEARLGAGRALVELSRGREALPLLAPLTGPMTPGEFAAPALYWSGRAALAQDDLRRAEGYFAGIVERSPGEAGLAEAGLLRVLDRAAARGATGDRGRALEALLRVGVGTADGELAAVRFGSELYLSGRFEEAAATFERYLEGGRRTLSRQQAAYWAALAHERRGEGARAGELLELTWSEDPFSFYGTFAAERLDAPVLPADLAAGPGAVPGLGDELANALVRLRIHQLVPTAGSFAFELARLEDHFFRRGDGAYDFAEALLAEGFPLQGIVLGRTIRAREGEWNLRLLRIVHPFPYREAIVRESRARGLDPFFVAGLIRQESMFHPTIRSVAGAVGLMQVMPGTGREVARAEGIRFSEAALADPNVNLRLGTAYLAQMIRRFDGRAEDALSAYNAGPGRIQQWRGRPEYRDTDVFLEHIPFRETRHYVKVVQQYTRIYTALYGCGNFEPCLGDSYRTVLARSPFAGGAPSSSLAR